MLKKYTAKTQVALTVMKKGKPMHVSFTPVTGGGSVYYTNDEDVARALENHYKFKKLFRLAGAQSDAANTPAPVNIARTQPQPAKQGDKKTPKEMPFPSYEDAKDWLVEQFEFSRTKLKTQKDIEKAALQKGVKIVIDE